MGTPRFMRPGMLLSRYSRNCRRIACLGLGFLCLTGIQVAEAQHEVTKEQVDRWTMELSNWGRWGDDDQLGTLNLMTAAKRKQAAGLVEEGVSVSLAQNVLTDAAVDVLHPFEHEMTAIGVGTGPAGNLDSYSVNYHGMAHTHIDGLCHVSFHGKMYNGFSQHGVTADGCADLSILHLKNGMFTRGILIDIPSLKGIPWLEPGTAIYPEDLEAWEEKTGIEILSGDAIFVRTGRWARRAASGPWNIAERSAGLHASTIKWLKKRDVAVIGTDAAADVIPSGVEGVALPIHQMAIVGLGAYIVDNCNLEDLGKTAASLERWTFLFTLAPLAVPGGTGSPVNPIATF